MLMSSKKANDFPTAAILGHGRGTARAKPHG